MLIVEEGLTITSLLYKIKKRKEELYNAYLRKYFLYDPHFDINTEIASDRRLNHFYYQIHCIYDEYTKQMAKQLNVDISTPQKRWDFAITIDYSKIK